MRTVTTVVLAVVALAVFSLASLSIASSTRAHQSAVVVGGVHDIQYGQHHWATLRHH